VVDWGVLGAILLGAAALWLVVVAAQRWRDGPLAAGALGALVVVGLQAGVDFGIEILGLAVPATMVIATLSFVPVKEVEAPVLLRSRIRTGALIAVIAAASALLLSPCTISIREDHEDLADIKTVRMADLAQVVDRHPLDFYPFALGAEMLARSHDPRAIAMLNHALVLHPTHPGLHHLAARTLFRSGHLDQAVIEYALAVREGPTLLAMLTEITTRFSAKQAARAIPTSLTTPTIVKILLDLGRPAVATEWLGLLLDESPNNLQACDGLYTAAIQRKDETAAMIASRRCRGSEPSYEARTKLARLLLDTAHLDEAAQLVADVEKWPGRVDVKVEGWLVSCDVIAARKQWNDTKRCLRMLDLSGLVLDNQRSLVVNRLDKVEEALRTKPSQ
jgi:tetratricopeptide (TPR) repeat protein